MTFNCSLLIIVFATKTLMLWSGLSAFLTLDFSMWSSQVWMWTVARMGMAPSAEESPLISAALLVHCVRIGILLLHSKGVDKQDIHVWKADRTGKCTMINQKRKCDFGLFTRQHPTFNLLWMWRDFGKVTTWTPVVFALFMTSFINVLCTLHGKGILSISGSYRVLF